MESVTAYIYLFVAFTGFVYGDVNVAVGKPASASSIYDQNLPPYKLVDGNDDPDWSSNSCFGTKKADTQPWWMVDLGAIYRVDKVAVINRGGCCGHRLHDFAIDVLVNNPAVHEEVSSKPCTFYPGGVELGATAILHCGTARLGRFVRLSRNMTDGPEDFLSLCEIKVYGTEERLTQWFFREVANQEMDGGMLYPALDQIDCSKGCYNNQTCMGFNYQVLPSAACFLIFELGTFTNNNQWNFYFLKDVLSCVFA